MIRYQKMSGPVLLTPACPMGKQNKRFKTTHFESHSRKTTDFMTRFYLEVTREAVAGS